MKTTVHLYGDLADKFTKTLKVSNATSMFKVISALSANFKEFQKFLIEYKPGFHVRVGDIYRSEDTVHEPIGSKDIHIIPAVSGSSGKVGAFFAIILGVALMFIPGMGGFGGTLIGKAMVSFGVGLVMSGISYLLFAPPQQDVGTTERPENTPNTYFNGAVNTINQGHPVPVGYGELIVGSAVISAGLDTVRI